MTFHKLALTTALATLTGVAAHAQVAAATPTEPEPELDSERALGDTATTPDRSAGATDAVMPDATVSADGMITAPRALPMKGKDLDSVDETAVDNILKEAANGARLNSVDNLTIGQATAYTKGDGAEDLIVVDVSEDADLAAERIAFEASSLRVERVGGLQYDYTLAQLREAVAARVAAMAEQADGKM